MHETSLEYARGCRVLADILRLPQTCWCEHHTGEHQWDDDEAPTTPLEVLQEGEEEHPPCAESSRT